MQSARSTQHDLTLCFALFGGCAVLLWCGRWADLAREADALMELATDRRLSFWKSWAQTYKDAHAYGAEGVVVPQWRSTMVSPHQLELMATVGDELLDGDALVRAEAGNSPWCAPEVLRAQGEKLLRQGASPQEAERWFSPLSRRGSNVESALLGVAGGYEPGSMLVEPGPAGRGDGVVDRRVGALHGRL